MKNTTGYIPKTTNDVIPKASDNTQMQEVNQGVGEIKVDEYMNNDEPIDVNELPDNFFSQD